MVKPVIIKMENEIHCVTCNELLGFIKTIKTGSVTLCGKCHTQLIEQTQRKEGTHKRSLLGELVEIANNNRRGT